MNLFLSFKLVRLRINRLVSPEVRQSTWQALLGLEKTVGGSLYKLIFRFVLHEFFGDVLTLINSLINSIG